ncbi:MAG: RNA 2',3'-cyclic phosphodiesterase [Armatimonadetes bacterium]|nr:RNA 2',3'-cyclic phosphodiesterase [Armatimonadota bacterium]
MRLFFAIDVPEEADEALFEAQRGLRELLACAKVSWAPQEKWHATIAFLGEVPETDLPQIIDAGRRAASRAEEFEVSLSGLGVFGTSARYGAAVWAGLKASGPAFELLAKDLRHSLREHCREREGAAFVPHVTLARVRQASPQQLKTLRTFVRSYTIRPSVPWQCARIILYESTPHTPNAPYRRILDFSL